MDTTNENGCGVRKLALSPVSVSKETIKRSKLERLQKVSKTL